MAETPFRGQDEDDDSDGFDESILKGLEVVDTWYDDDEEEKGGDVERQTSSSRASKEVDRLDKNDDRRTRGREHSREIEKEREREREKERERDIERERYRRHRDREAAVAREKWQMERSAREDPRKRRLEEAEKELLKLQQINERRAKEGRPLVKLPNSGIRRTLDELNARRAKMGLPLLTVPCEESPPRRQLALKGRDTQDDYADDNRYKGSKQPEENRIVKLEHLGEDLPSTRAKKLQVERYNRDSELSRNVVRSSSSDDNMGSHRSQKRHNEPYGKTKQPEEKGASQNLCVTQVLRHAPGTYTASVITYNTNITHGSSVSQLSTVVQTSIDEPPVPPPPPPKLGPISFKIGQSSKTAKTSSTVAHSEEEDDDKIDEDDDDFKPSRLSQRLLAATKASKSHKKAEASVYKRMDNRKKVYTSDASLDSISETSSPERDLQLSPVSSEPERGPSPVPRPSKLRRRQVSQKYASDAAGKVESSPPPSHASRQRRRVPVSRSPSPPVKRKRESPKEIKSAIRVPAAAAGYKSSKDRHRTVSVSPEPHGGAYGSPSGRNASPTEHGSRRRHRSPFWREIQRTLAEEQAMKRKQMQEMASHHSPVVSHHSPVASHRSPVPPSQPQAMYSGGQPTYQSAPPPAVSVPHPAVPVVPPPVSVPTHSLPPGVGPNYAAPRVPPPSGPHPGQLVGYPVQTPQQYMPPPNTYYEQQPANQWGGQSWMPQPQPQGTYQVAPPQAIPAPVVPAHPVVTPPAPVIPATPVVAAPAPAQPAPAQPYVPPQPVPPGSGTISFAPPPKSKAQTKRERQLAEFQFARPAIKPTDKGQKQNQDFQEFLIRSSG